MKSALLASILTLALQASDCATAGSIQDSQVTKAKREADAEDLTRPTPCPTPYPAPNSYTQPVLRGCQRAKDSSRLAGQR